MTEPVGTWNDDTFTALDGRSFSINSEHARGEDRYYWAMERVAEGTGNFDDGSIGASNWNKIHKAAGFDKRTVKRRVERYVRETMA